jgi:hypothetical protein
MDKPRFQAILDMGYPEEDVLDMLWDWEMPEMRRKWDKGMP